MKKIIIIALVITTGFATSFAKEKTKTAAKAKTHKTVTADKSDVGQGD